MCICKQLAGRELVCTQSKPEQRATYSAGESREVFNLAPRDPFSNKTDRREFPFHLAEQSEYLRSCLGRY